jgi:hypothetical protein
LRVVAITHYATRTVWQLNVVHNLAILKSGVVTTTALTGGWGRTGVLILIAVVFQPGRQVPTLVAGALVFIGLLVLNFFGALVLTLIGGAFPGPGLLGPLQVLFGLFD